MTHAWVSGLLLSAGLLASGTALAKVPPFAARCGGGIRVETDHAGRATIDGKRATVTSPNANFHTIRIPGGAVDVPSDAGGTLMATDTGRNRAHGVCEIVDQDTVENAPSAAAPRQLPARADDVPARDKTACLRAVRTQTKNRQVVVIKALSSEASNTVTVGVGPDRAPWRCLVKRGRVAGVMSQADEGAL